MYSRDFAAFAMRGAGFPAVAGDKGAIAAHIDPGKRQGHAVRLLHQRRQGEAEFFQLGFDARH